STNIYFRLPSPASGVRPYILKPHLPQHFHRLARPRAREAAGNQRPWPADKVERWAIDRLRQHIHRLPRPPARAAGRNQRPWPADKVERWSIDRLIPYANNARTHTDAQVAAIAASIKEWGWTRPA